MGRRATGWLREWRNLIAGALLVPASVAVYVSGFLVLFRSAPASAWSIALAFGWAFLALGGGAWLSAWLMTRDL